ncbi:hypothetical protein [Mesorhizobium sp. M0037]|uniref:hypothetical protein n=1 Tax=unclassified Mesorhizobium TaxID=325217 RepID=UPI00333ACE80
MDKDADKEANKLLHTLDEATQFAKDSHLPDQLKDEIAKKLRDTHAVISRWLSNAHRLN